MDGLSRLNELREKIAELHDSYTQILPLNLELVHLIKEVYGANSIDYTVALNDLGGIYRHLGCYDAATQVFTKSLNIIQETKSNKDPNYATVLNNFAGLLRLMKRYEEAEKLFLITISIYEHSLGNTHFLTLSALNNLGLLYQDLARDDEAEKLYERCLVALENQKDEHPIAYATTLNNLANIFEKKGDITRAIELIVKVLTLYQKSVGSSHSLYANALNNYATLLFKQGNLLKAKECFNEAIAINLKLFGAESEVYQNSIKNLEMVKTRLNSTNPISLSSNSFASVSLAQGMRMCERYYESLCLPVLKNIFPQHINRMAIGLVGEGSECYGFDDSLSQDHDFSPRIMVWLTKEDYAEFGAALQTVLRHLPKEFEGQSFSQMSSQHNARPDVFIIEDFYAKYLGFHHLPTSLQEWQKVPEHHLSVATNGKVFSDPVGEFTLFREHLLNFYPEDVRLKKIAARCMQLAQSGQYNFPRCIQRGENIAALSALTHFIDAIISMVFLINKRYKPFYKWMHRALKELPILGENVYQRLDNLAQAPNTEKVMAIEALCTLIIQHLTKEGLTDSTSDFLLDHGPSVLNRIHDPLLRNSNPWVE